MIEWVGLIDHDRALSSDRVIDHDCALGLLEHDQMIEEWVTCEYRVACHFHSWSKMWLKFSGFSHLFLDERASMSITVTLLGEFLLRLYGKVGGRVL